MDAASYASKTRGLVDVVRESLLQVRSQVWSARNADSLARHFIGEMRVNEQAAAAALGRPIAGLDLLDIGTGTIASQALYFACLGNRVTSIDLEPQSFGWDPRAYVAIARASGPRRAAKTLARKLIGFDRRFPRALARELGAPLPMTLLRMDATRMTFPDASFDLVYSYDVLEHVDDVEAVIQGVARVLRPGGLAYLVLNPYTCEDGAHDYRRIGGHRGDLPYWAHLRPEHAARVRPGAYVNKLGLRDVSAICERVMPGVDLRAPPVGGDELPNALRELRALGELAGYSDEELLAVRQQIVWRKPVAPE
jgi:SAM-dependent methyltransferase